MEVIFEYWHNTPSLPLCLFDTNQVTSRVRYCSIGRLKQLMHRKVDGHYNYDGDSRLLSILHDLNSKS